MAPAQVVIGIETDRGPWVQALLAAGYEVFAINPLSVARYRQRHVTSGAKSDPGDAQVLADLVRTDRQHHRPIAGDSELAEAVKVLARAHQNVCWMRGRQASALRSTLREFYPGALAAFDELAHPDALAVLGVAPTPAAGRRLSRSKIVSALRRSGRQRNVENRAEQIQGALRAPQLERPPLIAEAFGASVAAYVAMLATTVTQTRTLEGQLEASVGQHSAAGILLSQPGLGGILGARVLAEFGDDPTPLRQPQGPRELRRNRADHQGLGHPPRRARPGGHQQAAARRVAPAGLRGTDELPGRPRLLRRASRPRRRPQPGPASGQQSTGRHPARLPTTRPPLRRTHRLAPLPAPLPNSGLIFRTVGCLVPR
jgi:transposase